MTFLGGVCAVQSCLPGASRVVDDFFRQLETRIVDKDIT